MRKISFIMSFLIIFIIISSFALAQINDTRLYNSQSVDIGLKISSTITISPNSPDYNVNYVKASLSYFPRNDILQKVNLFNPTPDAKISDERLVFNWLNPTSGNYNFSLDTKIRIDNLMAIFTKRIPFPVLNLPESFDDYILPSSNIDSDNPSVVSKATELVTGESDMFEAVYKLAWWTNNEVTYNLSTLTSKASQKSSWVLKNKYGVCDEITNLFIGLCRAVGIPARFVSGISYTNSDLFKEKWGPHGWAEVYFPEVGWVPFDVTYGEFGYLDASHIKLKASLDSNESSVAYEWLSHGVDVKATPLKFDTHLIAAYGEIKDSFNIIATPLKEKVGFGSYNALSVKVTNPTNHYVPAQVFITKTEGLELFGDISQEILLKPNSVKKLFWKFKVNDNLDSNYIYTFPIEVYTQAGQNIKLNFKAIDNEPLYSEKEIDDYIDSLSDVEKKVYSKKVSFNCSSTKESYYLYEAPLIECNIQNLGNVLLPDLKFCLDLKCQNFDLGIGKSKILKTNFIVDKSGNYEKDLIVRGDKITKTTKVNLSILDEPKISIINLTYPTNISYNENSSISYLISKDSFSNPVNVKITLTNGYATKNWNLDYLNNNQNYIVYLDTSDLSKVNDFILNISYEDLNGKTYSVKDTFTINLNDLSTFENAEIFYKDVLRLIDSNILLSTIIISGLVFLIILIIVFSGNSLRSERRKLKRESDKKFLKEMKKEEKEDSKYFK